MWRHTWPHKIDKLRLHFRQQKVHEGTESTFANQLFKMDIFKTYQMYRYPKNVSFANHYSLFFGFCMHLLGRGRTCSSKLVEFVD